MVRERAAAVQKHSAQHSGVCGGLADSRGGERGSVVDDQCYDAGAWSWDFGADALCAGPHPLQRCVCLPLHTCVFATETVK